MDFKNRVINLTIVTYKVPAVVKGEDIILNEHQKEETTKEPLQVVGQEGLLEATKELGNFNHQSEQTFLNNHKEGNNQESFILYKYII